MWVPELSLLQTDTEQQPAHKTGNCSKQVGQRKIIVLTPVKNEAWILDIFLQVASTFADHIIIADQHSTDDSAAIAKKYRKVLLLRNDSVQYNEAERQQLLISVARKQFGMGNILLALDADELIAHSSLQSAEWNVLKKADAGTVLYFEKPTFINGTSHVIRYRRSGGWPLGFVDDGRQHNAQLIHSNRVPFDPERSPRLYLKEILFLHLNLIDLHRQRSKIRYYCMLETIARTKAWRHRLWQYHSNYDYARNEGDGLELAPPQWLNGWNQLSTVLNQSASSSYHWYDRECLQLMAQYGSRKFWFEDVWDMDWDGAKQHFGMNNMILAAPPKIAHIARNCAYVLFKNIRRIKQARISGQLKRPAPEWATS